MFLSVMTSAFSVGLNVTGFAGDVKGGDVGFILFDKVNINMSAGVTYNTREITKEDNTPLILVSPGLYILSSIFEGSDKKTSNYTGGFYQLDWTTPALRIGQVRFNGKDYVNADLEKRIRVTSRNELIVSILEEYFTSGEAALRQGVIFCVNVNHAKNQNNHPPSSFPSGLRLYLTKLVT